jgi:uncharacterized membrane protein HdeD (DUF308 family)
MSSPQPSGLFASFSVDAAELSKSSINTIRTTLGISGAVALIIGILITFWPERSAAVLTAILAIYLLIAGIAYLGMGIFSRGISGGARALDIIVGILFIVGAILAFANLAQTTAVLAVFIAVLIGVLWIVEGVVALAQLGDAPSKGWAIFFGLLSIIAGIVVLFSPLWAAELLFVIAGIALIVLGIVQIVRAFTFGRGVRATA